MNLPIDLPSLLSLQGMTAFIYMVMAAVKQTGFIADRFIPIMAIALGAVTGLIAAYLGHADIGAALLLGAVSGGLASGVEETRKGVTQIVSRKPDSKNVTLTGVLSGATLEFGSPKAAETKPIDPSAQG